MTEAREESPGAPGGDDLARARPPGSDETREAPRGSEEVARRAVPHDAMKEFEDEIIQGARELAPTYLEERECIATYLDGKSKEWLKLAREEQESDKPVGDKSFVRFERLSTVAATLAVEAASIRVGSHR